MHYPLIAGIEEFPELKRAYEQAIRAAGNPGCPAGCVTDTIVSKYQQMLTAKRLDRQQVRTTKIKYPGIHN